MDELNINELKELVLFYNRKCAELELQSLERQLKINRLSDTISRLTVHLEAMNAPRQPEVVQEQPTKPKTVAKKTKTGK
jgi:hypothetical protein